VNRTESNVKRIAEGYTPLKLDDIQVENLAQRQFFENLLVIKSHYQLIELQLK
jgi:hypothetical protein